LHNKCNHAQKLKVLEFDLKQMKTQWGSSKLDPLAHNVLQKERNSKGNNENLKDLNNVLLQCKFNLTKQVIYEKTSMQ
jgi:hypothetical protein